MGTTTWLPEGREAGAPDRPPPALGLWERPNLPADWSPLRNIGGLKGIFPEDSEAWAGVGGAGGAAGPRLSALSL